MGKYCFPPPTNPVKISGTCYRFENIPFVKAIQLDFVNSSLETMSAMFPSHSSRGQGNPPISVIIIHQTHYEKSDWSRAFNQFTIACELDMINEISAADVAFNVCLVTKPLGVFSSETKWLNASLLFLRMNYVKNV